MGESFGSVAARVVKPLVNTALLHAGFHSDSDMAVQAANGIKALLKDPASCSAKDKIDELMVQCTDILDGGMNLTEAIEQLPALLEITWY